jgi:hypothetical protein
VFFVFNQSVQPRANLVHIPTVSNKEPIKDGLKEGEVAARDVQLTYASQTRAVLGIRS